MSRWSQDAPVALLARVEAEAKRNGRTRGEEVRRLIAEAMDARDVTLRAERAAKREENGGAKKVEVAA